MKRALPISLLALLGASCDCDDCDDDFHSFPTYFESEPNDTPASANDFGTLVNGDHFFIEGFSTDRGTDPFDGFAFTAGAALHVDFYLYTDNPAADLDVCLYDPLLDQTLACFATAANPELGGVDVVGAGFEFQLVVESFAGESSYALEIVVTPLFLGLEAEGSAADVPHLRATGVPASERDPRARGGYRDELVGGPEIESIVRIDRETGLVLAIVRRKSLD
jgi:hypothetical protein